MKKSTLKEIDAIVLNSDGLGYEELTSYGKAFTEEGDFRFRFRDVRLPVDSLAAILGKEPTYLFVLVLDNSMLKNTGLANVLDELFSYASSHSEIMVLPWLKGITVAQLEQMAYHDSPVAVSIVENVHLDASLEQPQGVVDAIKRHLGSFWLREEETFFRGRARRFMRLLEIAAWVVIAALCVLVQAKYSVGTKPSSAWARWIIWPDSVSVLGIAAFAVVSFDLMWRSIFAVSGIILGRAIRAMRWVAFAFVGYSFWFWDSRIGVTSWINHDWDLLLLGGGIGAVLVALMRDGSRARFQVDFARIPLLLEKREAVGDFFKWAMRKFCFSSSIMLPTACSSYFVSYSRSSPWCVNTAQELSASLKSMNTRVFLDREALQAGDAWKARIESSLNEIDIFVHIIDEQASKKKWVIAEFLTALLGAAARKSPAIVILHPPDFKPLEASGNQFAMVFSGILQEVKTRNMWWLKTHLFAYTPANSEQICAYLRYGLNRFWMAKVTLFFCCFFFYFSFFLLGSILLFAIPLLATNSHAKIFINNHEYSIQSVFIIAIGFMSFGIPLMLFEMTRKTRIAGVIALSGFLFLVLLSANACNYKTYLLAAIVAYGCAALGEAFHRELKGRNLGELNAQISTATTKCEPP